jgi:hypothetical protein
MTQDEIIFLADASGISLYGMGLDRQKFIHYLEAFAKLVAQHTLSNIDPSKFMSYQEGMEAGRLAERDACAKAVLAIANDDAGNPYKQALRIGAEAIRARGQA